MWEQLALRGVSFLQKRQQARTQAAWDRYNNAMSGIQAGQASNAISTNAANLRSQNARNRVSIEKSRLMAAAKVKAGAAAAGVAGRSVDDTLFDLGRNAGNRLHEQKIRFSASMAGIGQQKRSVAMQRQLSQKQITQGPSLLGEIANGALDILGERVTAPGSDGTLLEGGEPTQETTGPLSAIRNMLDI